MKQIDQLVQQAFPEQLTQVLPVSINEARVRERAFAKLGLSGLKHEEKTAPAGPLHDEKIFTNPAVKPAPAITKKRKWPRVLLSSGIAVAACAVLLLGVNAVNPAFTENLPALGAAFRALNGSREELPPEIPPDTTAPPRVSPSPSPSSAPPWGDLYFRSNIRDAFLVGSELHLTLQAHTSLDPGAETSQWYYELTLNGEGLSMYDGDSLNTFRTWVKTADDTCYNDGIVIPLPEEDRLRLLENPEGENTLHLVLTDLSSMEQKQYIQELTFTPSIAEESTVDVSGAEQNGITVTAFYRTANEARKQADIQATVDMGEELASTDQDTATARLELYRSDGSRLALSTGETPSPGVLHYRFTSNYDDRLLFLRAMRRDTGAGLTDPGQLLAEFTIDLEQGICVPSRKYQDAGSPLFWDAGLLGQELWVYPYYRASDEELAGLEDGYRVEYLSRSLSFQPYGGSVFLNLATPREYRELAVNISNESGILASGITSPTFQGRVSPTDEEESSASLFQPFSEYSIREFDRNFTHPELIQEVGKTFMTGDDGPRELDLSGLNIQTVWLGQISLMPFDHTPLDVGTYTINVFDKESGENVLTQEIQLVLPDDVPLNEGERLARMCAETYPYVPIPYQNAD